MTVQCSIIGTKENVHDQAKI